MQTIRQPMGNYLRKTRFGFHPGRNQNTVRLRLRKVSKKITTSLIGVSNLGRWMLYRLVMNLSMGSPTSM